VVSHCNGRGTRARWAFSGLLASAPPSAAESKCLSLVIGVPPPVLPNGEPRGHLRMKTSRSSARPLIPPVSAAAILAFLALLVAFPAVVTAAPGEGPRVDDQSADIGITLSTSVEQIMPGDTFDYTLTVSNQGPGTARNVVVTDTLPAGVSLVRSTLFGSGDGRRVRFAIGTLAPNARTTVVLTVQVVSGLPRERANIARVTDDATLDPNRGDNRAGAILRVRDRRPPGDELSLLPFDTLLPSAFAGRPYRMTFIGTGGQPPLALVGGNAPPGMAFVNNAANQIELRGTPTQSGNFVVRVELGDSAAREASIVSNFTLPIGVNLDLLPRALPLAQVGEHFHVTLMTANGVPPEGFTSSDPLPPGFALNGNSLAGAPTVVGDFGFNIEATDSGGNQGLRNYTLRALPVGMVFVGDELPVGVARASYRARVRAIGGVKPYRWRVDSALPDGLTFDEDGSFGGIPRAPGKDVVTVTARDQMGAAVSADLALTIKRTGLVSWLPETLPEGVLGSPYSLPIRPEGGRPPYRLAMIGGQLPPGLSISGVATAQASASDGPVPTGDSFVVSGIPVVAGAFPSQILISDSSNRRNRVMLSLEIVVHTLTPD
jgi:uncharacterized repeat protein (TIGR01451 family)